MKIKLYDCFKHWNSFDSIWLFSDPHFSDPDCKLMDPNWPTPEEQVKIINSKVSKKDCIIFLGDIGNTEYIKQIKGYKILITGNHDLGVSNYKRKIDKEFIKVSDEVMNDPNFNECRLNGNFEVINKKIVRKYLEEYKTKKDFAGISDVETDTRRGDYLTITYDNKLFDEVYDGQLFINDKILLSHEPVVLPFALNVCGHCHGKEQSIYRPGFYARVNLAADVINYTPVRLDKLVEEYKVTTQHRLTIDSATEKKCPIDDLNSKFCNKECK